MTKILTRIALIGVVALVAGTTASTAYFNTGLTVSNNTFTTGQLGLTLNGTPNNITSGTLAAMNMYPGSYVEASVDLKNTGSIDEIPSFSLANAVDPNGMASQMNIKVWTETTLNNVTSEAYYYNGALTNFPGYTNTTLNFQNIAPGQHLYVAVQFSLNPNATAQGSYKVDVKFGGHQFNDTSYTQSTVYATTGYVVTSQHGAVCGYTGDVNDVTNEPVWQPSNATYSCTVPAGPLTVHP